MEDKLVFNAGMSSVDLLCFSINKPALAKIKCILASDLIVFVINGLLLGAASVYLLLNKVQIFAVICFIVLMCSTFCIYLSLMLLKLPKGTVYSNEEPQKMLNESIKLRRCLTLTELITLMVICLFGILLSARAPGNQSDAEVKKQQMIIYGSLFLFFSVLLLFEEKAHRGLCDSTMILAVKPSLNDII